MQLLALAWLSGVAVVSGQTSKGQVEVENLEYELKIKYLYNFIQFVEWPDDGSPQRELVIGIDNTEDFGNYIKLLESQTKGQRPLRVVSIKNGKSLERCDLVYFETESRRKVREYIKTLNDRPVLVVTDDLDVDGSIIALRFKHRTKKYGFVINKAKADRLGIKFNSRLLILASRVIEEEKD